MKILVCGGREYFDREHVNNILDLYKNKIELMITGGATGADTLAHKWAIGNNLKAVIVPADWKKHGKRAGMIRNQTMLELKPNLIVAFPGGSGTADMIKRGNRADIQVVEVAMRSDYIHKPQIFERAGF